jgi:hypothetical protein
MQILIFHPDRCVPPSTVAHTFDGVALVPGRNNLTPDSLTLVLSHPDFPKYKNWGAINVIEPTVETETVQHNANSELESLAKYNVEDIDEILDATNDVELLQKWLQKETRKTVRPQIILRINAIKAGNE